MTARMSAILLVAAILFVGSVASAATNQAVFQQLEEKYELPPTILARIANAENGGRATGCASTSSACGMFQWLSGSWRATSAKVFPDRGALDLSLRNDPATAAEVTAWSLRFTKNYLGGLIQQSGVGEMTALYLGHFLGPAGARKLLQVYMQNPNDSVADLFPRAAAANASAFRGRTVAGLIQLAAQKMRDASTTVRGNANADPLSQSPPFFNSHLKPTSFLPSFMTPQNDPERDYQTDYSQSSGRSQYQPDQQRESQTSGDPAQSLSQLIRPTRASVPFAAGINVQPETISRGGSGRVSWTSVGTTANSPCRVTVVIDGREVLVGEGNEGTRPIRIGVNSSPGTLVFTMKCTTLIGASAERTDELLVI